MGFPEGFYRTNGPAVDAKGNPIGPSPWSKPEWPAFLRYTARPLAEGGLKVTPWEQQQVLNPPGWFSYCGPVEQRYVKDVEKALTPLAFQAGYWLYGEPILVHPHTLYRPWPTLQTNCYGWAWEMARPVIYVAVWDGYALKYVADGT